MSVRIAWLSVCTIALVSSAALAQAPPGEAPALGGDRVTQDAVVNDLNLGKIQEAGMLVFTTPFNRFDGHGDGPMDLVDSVSPGGRPTLQGNGQFLRVNGLDGQSCLDCHAIVSAATRPPTLGIGGVGTANNNAIIMPTLIEPADLIDKDGAADFNGRFANPPFVFGAGGVELLAAEMTADLQALRTNALASPGTVVELVTKGVRFGTIVADTLGGLDTSNVEGIEDDLVVRPFGRKGEFSTVRDFDIGAMQFHFGMQPTEVVGEDVDSDGDGVVNEILVGELSALSVFITTLDRPVTDPMSQAASRGFDNFQTVGCAECHMPSLETESQTLGLRFPEVPTDPSVNVFYEVDLTKAPARFDSNGEGGITVPLFSDLKRHDMGPGLAETFALADEETNRSFVTARLWGIADTAPYLHDGRATTLTEAIVMHGGEADQARAAFEALDADDRTDVLEFLRTLRTPQPRGNRGGPRPSLFNIGSGGRPGVWIGQERR